MKKKAELQEDENVWNPRLWIESCGGLTRGRVYGAPSFDTSTILQRGPQSNLLADRANQEYMAQPVMSTGLTLTSELKSIIEKEVQLAITSLYGSTGHSNIQRINQQSWMFSQPPGQIPQPSGQPFLQPPSQISQPPTQPFMQQPSQISQPCDQQFLQIPNQISQPSGQLTPSLYQFAQPFIPYHQTLEQYQSMHVPFQSTSENFPQQGGSFMQLLRPTTQDQPDQNQLGNYQETNHHRNHLSQNEDDT